MPTYFPTTLYMFAATGAESLQLLCVSESANGQSVSE
jgi:hypothetical protein